ncbi:MAG: ParA family protein [Rhodospirillaceae bacterium]
MADIIAIASQKGGAGKTTLTMALAGQALIAGQRVVILDLDPQASVSTWSDQRDSEAPIVASIQAARLQQELTHAHKIADLILLDTPPHAESTTLAVARAADLVLIPCRPGFLDIMAIRATADMVTMAGKRPVIVFNGVRPNSKQAQDAASAVAALPADVCSGHLSYRSDFDSAVTAGKTVQEHAPRSKAADEVAAVFKWVALRLPRKP